LSKFGFSNLFTLALSPTGTGIYTIILHNENNGLKSCQAPSPAGEGWGEENKIKCFIPPHPSLLPLEKGRYNLCRYLCSNRRGNEDAEF
jgi:hypothetical protein